MELGYGTGPLNIVVAGVLPKLVAVDAINRMPMSDISIADANGHKILDPMAKRHSPTQPSITENRVVVALRLTMGQMIHLGIATFQQ